MLSYISTIENWLDDSTLSQTPIASCAISLLNDFYYNPAIINFEAHHVAAACLVITFQIYGLKVPAVDADTWYKAFCPDMSIEFAWEIIEQILKVYEFEMDVERN